MEPTIERFCSSLVRSHLIPPDEVRSLHQRWAQQAGAKTALNDFMKWLVANQALTEYQAGVVARGHADQLFLGQYKILDRVGKGRMAGVYRAVHQLGQIVAIKVLPPSKVKDEQTFGRFQRESLLALRLKHPNLVRTFQTGEANGLHYLVMEYLEGETLEDVLKRRGKLSTGEAIHLLYQAFQGLQHIYDQGLIHRDLKPGNLMILGGQPNSVLHASVKILDIGLGRSLFDDASSAAGTELTNDGELLGTPEYMSPEQARDPRAADIRADIYSLGCVLYHTLAGQPPFADNNPVRLLVRIATEEPKPIRAHNPAVPEGLQQVLNWMLAKDPAKRYAIPQRAAQAVEMFRPAMEEPRTPKNAQMESYLTWLESQHTMLVIGEAIPVTQAVVPVAQPAIAVQKAPGAPAAPTAPAPQRVTRAATVSSQPTRLAPAAKAPPQTPAPPLTQQVRKPAPLSIPDEEEEESAPFITPMQAALVSGGILILVGVLIGLWLLLRS